MKAPSSDRMCGYGRYRARWEFAKAGFAKDRKIGKHRCVAVIGVKPTGGR